MAGPAEALLASLLAGIATGVGALPLFFRKSFSHRTEDGLLGFAGGVMFAAAAFSLIIPGLSLGSVWQVSLGMAAGASIVFLLNRLIPHAHAHFSHGAALSPALRRGMLVAGAIAIHNFPEGFAVGAGYTSGIPSAGLILAIAIAIQNAPEGLAVAAPFRGAGASRLKCLAIATLSGLAEPIAALFGISIASLGGSFLPFALGFAAGAMICVVSGEILPESHSHGHSDSATLAFFLGFLMMLLLGQIFA